MVTLIAPPGHQCPPGHAWAHFTMLGAILIVLEFVVDGTVGMFMDESDDGYAGMPLAAPFDITTGGIFSGLAVQLAAER